MDEMMKVFTFGGFKILLGETPAPDLGTRKAEALLVYLVATRRPQAREVLADLLWDERSQRQALSNLRVVLAALRKHLAPYFTIERDSVALNPDAPIWSDSGELEARLQALHRAGGIASEAEAQQLGQALDLYRGEFLEGFYARDSRGFDEWLVRERERLHRLALGGLHELVEHALQSGDYQGGLARAAQLLALDSLDETAHRQMMQLLAFSGRRSEALAQFESCRRLLWDELGMEPSAAVKALAEKIRAGELARPRPPLRAIRGYELQEQIGSGSYGAVYRAYQPAVGREVAVKVILPQYANDPQFIRRFEVEAQVIARLESPRIVPLYDYWREPDGAYLVMRLLKGGSVEGLLGNGPLEAGRAVELVEQVAAGLSLAHGQGVIHRDLKPANILLDESGNAYLADFGLAKVLEGDGRQSGTGEVIGTPLYMSPEQLRNLALGPASDQYSLGIILYELLAGQAPFPEGSLAELIDRQLNRALPAVREARPELPAEVDEVIGRATAKDPAARYPDALALAAAFRQALFGQAAPARVSRPMPGVALANPYKGLSAFEEADAADFFGREALAERLVGRLGEAGEFARFLAVVGPSGSGKSSLVKAGLLPALRGGALPGSDKWYIVELLPGSHPFEELEINLLRVATNPALSLAEHLRRDRRGLARAARLALPGEGDELLLVIDQFEELFTLVEDRDEAKRFLDNLHAAATEPRSRVRVVVTLRADFYDRPLMHPDFSALVQARTEVVVPLSADELERAIRLPAERAGVEVEPGLATALVADTVQQPGALPLLQFALMELFERRGDHTLALADYQALGGVEGVLEGRAEAVYGGLAEAGQAAARQLFLRLVTLGEGVEDTRRRALLSELEGLGGDSPDGGMGPVIEAFGKARLLSFDRDPLTRTPTVEVAHEALLREWGRLREWLDGSRDDLRMQRVLGGAAADWEKSGREESFLLRGVRLDGYAAWQETSGLALTGGERAYLEASLAARQARREAEAQRQAREAALERRSRRVLRGLVAVFAVAAVVAGLLSLFAFSQQRIAARAAQVNQSLALAAQSRLALQAGNLDLALALGMEANRIPDPPGQAQMALSEAAYAPGTVRLFLGHQKPVMSIAVSPDGRYGLSGDGRWDPRSQEDQAGVIYLWDLETGEALRRLEGHTDAVLDLAFTPDGRQAISASRDKTVIHWDLETGEILRRFTAHQDGVPTVAVSPDGRLAASGSGRLTFGEPFSAADNSVRLWDLQSGEEIRRFELFTDGVSGLSFTPDGRRLAVSGIADGLTLIDLETGKALVRPGGWDEMSEVAVSPDGGKALTAASTPLNNHAGFGFPVTLWDLQTGEALKQLVGHNSSVFGLVISPDGRRALGGSNTLIEWDLETGEQVSRFNFSANAIAYRPDGRTALIGSEDGTVRLLVLDPGAEIGRFPTGSEFVKDVAYSPDGRTALTNDTQDLHLWDLETGKNIWTVNSTGGFVYHSFSPDGKQILASEVDFVNVMDAATGEKLGKLEGGIVFAFDPDSRIVLSGIDKLIHWDLKTGERVKEIDTGDVAGVAISPDGRTALSAEFDGSVNWWDLETGERLRRMEGHTNFVWSVAFVDDRTALSASEDSTMILWDLESGSPIRSFLGHSGGIKRVALSPDRRLALTASRDKTMILWDVQSGEPLRRYAGHSDQLRTVAWHPGGKEALTGGNDNQAIRWRIDADLPAFLAWVEQNRYVRELTCAERQAYHVEPPCEGEIATEPDSPTAPPQGSGAALLSPLPLPEQLPVEPSPAPIQAKPAGAASWGVNLGEIPAGGGQVWEYAGRAGERLSIRVAADRPADRTWGVERQRESGVLDPTLAVYAPDGNLLAESDDLENGLTTDAYLAALTLPETGAFRIEVRSYQDQTAGGYRLNLAEPSPLVFQAGLYTAAGLAITPNGRTALVGTGNRLFEALTVDNRIWVWDLVTGEAARQMEGHTSMPAALAASPDGRRALSAGLDGVAILWDLETGVEIGRLDNQGVALWCVLFGPDDLTALTCSDDLDLILWDLESGKVIRRFEGHTGWLTDLALAPDGKTAYSTAWDNTVRAWDLAGGKQIALYQPFATGQTIGLAVSPDGARLLVGGGEYTVHPIERPNAPIALLDAKTGEELLTLEGHTSWVSSVAFSPEGRYALSGSRDLTVRLWNLTTGEQLAVFTGHTDEVWKVAFSPDGLTGYSTSLDGSLRVWDLSLYIGGE
jgi:WD40 repeat protein/DNA-binding SARP family transcriptional activator